jgi:hypothetical protein
MVRFIPCAQITVASPAATTGGNCRVRSAARGSIPPCCCHRPHTIRRFAETHFRMYSSRSQPFLPMWREYTTAFGTMSITNTRSGPRQRRFIPNPDEPLYIDVQFWRAAPAKIAHQYITLYPNLVSVMSPRGTNGRRASGRARNGRASASTRPGSLTAFGMTSWLAHSVIPNAVRDPGGGRNQASHPDTFLRSNG